MPYPPRPTCIRASNGPPVRPSRPHGLPIRPTARRTPDPPRLSPPTPPADPGAAGGLLPRGALLSHLLGGAQAPHRPVRRPVDRALSRQRRLWWQPVSPDQMGPCRTSGTRTQRALLGQETAAAPP